jgi:hypothetical protein
MKQDLAQIVETLLKELDRLESLPETEIAPPGVWIHQYTIHRRYSLEIIHDYVYAKWHAHKPIFKRNPKKRGKRPGKGKDPEYTCHQHIGRVSSTSGLGAVDEVIEAYEQWNNRLRLEAIQQALAGIKDIVNQTQWALQADTEEEEVGD